MQSLFTEPRRPAVSNIPLSGSKPILGISFLRVVSLSLKAHRWSNKISEANEAPPLQRRFVPVALQLRCPALDSALRFCFRQHRVACGILVLKSGIEPGLWQ